MRKISHMFVVSCAIAAAAACGSNNTPNRSAADRNGSGPAASDRAAADQREKGSPITMTGCLQRDGGTYILTKINEPAQRSVGTTGSPGAVEREQIREARNAYRIDPASDVKLDEMIGKQVKITGTLAEPSDIAASSSTGKANDRENDRGTTGSNDTSRSDMKKPGGAVDKNGSDIDKGDLGKIAATSASVVSDSCGQAATKGEKESSKSKRR